MKPPGLDDTTAFDLNIVMNTTYMIGTVSSWFLTKLFASRGIYIAGAAFCCMHCLILGILGCFHSTNVSWATGAGVRSDTGLRLRMEVRGKNARWRNLSLPQSTAAAVAG